MLDLKYDIQKEISKIVPLLKEFASRCRGCGLCIQNCVFNEYTKDASKKIMTEIKEFILSDKEMGKETKKFIWNCVTCEHCNFACPLPEKIPKNAYFMFLRGILAERDEIPSSLKTIRNMVKGRKGKKRKKPFLQTIFQPLSRMAFPDWKTSTDPDHVRQRE